MPKNYYSCRHWASQALGVVMTGHAQMKDEQIWHSPCAHEQSPEPAAPADAGLRAGAGSGKRCEHQPWRLHFTLQGAFGCGATLPGPPLHLFGCVHLFRLSCLFAARLCAYAEMAVYSVNCATLAFAVHKRPEHDEA
eukprot:1156299-Pelagomonas_calceolata.AAC.11